MTEKKNSHFSESYETLRVFEFKKNKKEFTSVIVKNKENEYFLYTKGEPLEMYNLCQKSTLAYNYTQTISKYSSKGYNCISLAYKQIEEKDIDLPREKLENNLIFLGFYLKKICIEENFPEVVDQLKEHNLQMIVTSNTSLYLAISAATRANIMDPDRAVLIGRTSLINNMETLTWEKIESKKEDFENSVLEPAEDLNVTEGEFFENTEC